MPNWLALLAEVHYADWRRFINGIGTRTTAYLIHKTCSIAKNIGNPYGVGCLCTATIPCPNLSAKKIAGELMSFG